MTTKICFKCRRELPTTAFTAHPRTADRLQTNCRACCCDYARARHLAKREQILALKRQHQGPETNARCYASRRRHPNHYRARQIASLAIRRGALRRQPCEQCGDPKAHAHHDDYSKPLQVRWLCTKHHGETHRADSRALIGATA